jgi:hypothetical protein
MTEFVSQENRDAYAAGVQADLAVFQRRLERAHTPEQAAALKLQITAAKAEIKRAQQVSFAR